ncbi:hypothetical protein HDV03_004619 [Kappamyces sp. JEL0829]|nr:hypothetical protein HDV03_004619 [Kappamyces sp. JEL0829]
MDQETEWHCDSLIQMAQIYSEHSNVVLDVVYLHEKASRENRVQEVYETLGIMEKPGLSRSYEMTRSYKRFMLAMTELLGNPSVSHKWPLD